MWYAKKTSAEQGMVIDDETGRTVAVTYEAEDAPVIAAAPDMLAALQELCADKYLADPINAGRMANARAPQSPRQPAMFDCIGEFMAAACVIALPYLLLFIAAALGY